MKLTAQQKKAVSVFYQTQLQFPNNVSSQKWSWIGSGSIPLDYSLVLDHESNDDHSSVSVLTFVGTIALVESDEWKTYVHLTGVDPNLSDLTVWNQQLQGLNAVIDQFPMVNGKTYQCPPGTLSDHHVSFKIKNLNTLSEKQTATNVTDVNDTLLTGEYTSILNSGDLVIISFVPYAYDIQNYHGMSLSPKTIKIVKPKYVSKSAFDNLGLVSLIQKRGETPKKVSKVILPCKTPPTMNLGF
ncbi:MAG: hypothetical protein RLZZ86_2621 [Cyanobacteriota bacterium]